MDERTKFGPEEAETLLEELGDVPDPALTAAYAEQMKAGAWQASQMDKPRTGLMKALLIDDNDQVRLATQVALQRWGYEVVIATNGTDGLQLAQEGEFDVIVCDLEMPGLYGNEVFAELSPEKQGRFVLHTGNVQAASDFEGTMTVHQKGQAPSELRDVLERLAQRGTV